jgi:5,6-dimethylbenzimidazole synthase
VQPRRPDATVIGEPILIEARKPSAPPFDPEFRARLHELFLWRRDVRRFRTDPLADGALERLIETACFAPSVGLSQPWRFVVVDDPTRRKFIIDNFEACNRQATASYPADRAAAYAALKLAGLREAPHHMAVFADEDRPLGHGLGRMTMPEMLRYSVVGAIFNLWLAARAEGIGMGWISILDPVRVSAILEVPESWRLIGYFCLGYPEQEDDTPELERESWEQRQASDTFIVRR